MTKRPHVVIVLARCHSDRSTFGIRFEEKTNRNWIADWSFRVQATVATREGYGSQKISGAIRFAAEYPGCPACKNGSIFQCFCGKHTCWNGEQRTVTCAWCNSTVTLDRTITSIDATANM